MIIKILENAFIKARKYLLTEGYEEAQVIRKNPSGDISRAFDIKAEEILINDLKGQFPDFGIISGEVGEIKDGKGGKSDKFFIIGPVDGSFNFLRRIGGAGLSIALFEGGIKDLRNVTHGFIGNYITEDIFFAKKGLGAFLNYKKIGCTKTTKVSDATMGIDFDYNSPSDRAKLFNLLTLVYKIRYIGSASIDLCNVACGAYDAHIDVRDDLTPENFCAAQLIIREADGVFTDKLGNEIREFSMIDRFSIIACSTSKLNKEIVDSTM